MANWETKTEDIYRNEGPNKSGERRVTARKRGVRIPIGEET